MTDNDDDADMSLGKVLKIYIGVIPWGAHFLECVHVIYF